MSGSRAREIILLWEKEIVTNSEQEKWFFCKEKKTVSGSGAREIILLHEKKTMSDSRTREMI